MYNRLFKHPDLIRILPVWVRLVVGGQEQKHFSPLGTELYFFVNYSRKNAIVLTHNMVALSRGCKPGRCDRDRTKPDFDICSETFK